MKPPPAREKLGYPSSWNGNSYKKDVELLSNKIV